MRLEQRLLAVSSQSLSVSRLRVGVSALLGTPVQLLGEAPVARVPGAGGDRS